MATWIGASRTIDDAIASAVNTLRLATVANAAMTGTTSFGAMISTRSARLFSRPETWR